MATLNPYLNFNGNTEEVFNFYKSVFGGEFIGGISRFKDTPEGAKLSKADGEKVMHVALPIGKGNMLMGTDSVDGMGQKLVVGNNLSITVNPESEAETHKLFDGLAAGGTVLVPLNKAFWGGYFGMFADKFGVQWMINYTYKK